MVSKVTAVIMDIGLGHLVHTLVPRMVVTNILSYSFRSLAVSDEIITDDG